LSLDSNNCAIKERHNGSIRREGNLEGSVGIPGLPTAEETAYIAIGFVEEIGNVKAVVQLDTNRGRRGVLKEEINGTFTNNIGTEPVDPTSMDKAEVSEVREVGSHVSRSTSVKYPHITES
jgi:hypothetical protein